MRVVIDATATQLDAEDVANLKRLDVVIVQPATEAAGFLDSYDSWMDGPHVWLAVEVLRGLGAADAVGDGWLEDFEQMISFAADHGWTTPTRSHVRAHIVDVEVDAQER